MTIILLSVALGVLVIFSLIRPLVKIPIVDNYLRKKIITRRQKKQLSKMTEGQKKTIKGLRNLSEFVDWLNKQFKNSKERKQFYRDFQDKDYRQQWLNKLIKQMESKVTNLETQKKNVGKKPRKVRANAENANVTKEQAKKTVKNSKGQRK